MNNPKKILYIDNRQYGHNADLHIEFIASLDNKIDYNIIGYGNYLSKYLKNSIRVPVNSGYKKYNIHDDVDIKKASQLLDSILLKHKPDIILTYNSNGSSYEVELDNIGLYRWISESLSKIDIPKYHISTDYCRSGFREDQAKWFEYVGYTGAIFRHKESMKYPLSIPKYWLPFSIDKERYINNIDKNILHKNKKVGFVGAAHNSSKDLYIKRIKAIEYLNRMNLLVTTSKNNNINDRRVIVGSEYIKFINSNIFNLTCGGTCNYFTAKYIQIPGAYSLLVCSNTNGLENFPKDSYIIYDINHLDKLLYDIKYHISNISLAKEKIELLHNFIIKNYTHDLAKNSIKKIIV